VRAGGRGVRPVDRHGGHVFHGELDAFEVLAPAVLEVLHGVEDEVVEPLAAGLGQRHRHITAADRHRRRHEAPTQPAATTVAAARPVPGSRHDPAGYPRYRRPL
jgi:hypothetical protein